MSQRVLLARGGPLPILQPSLPHGGRRDVRYDHDGLLEGWPRTLIGYAGHERVASESRARQPTQLLASVRQEARFRPHGTN